MEQAGLLDLQKETVLLLAEIQHSLQQHHKDQEQMKVLLAGMLATMLDKDNL